MTKLWVVPVLAWLALGCGSAAGSLDGKVQGHEVAVKEAVFISFPDGEMFVAAANQENLCAILNGEQKPMDEMDILEVDLANWNGTRVEPLVTGTYALSRQPTVAGHWFLADLFWTKECTTFGALSPSSGTATVESVPGSQAVVSVDLAFGDEHLTGELRATYCALANQSGTACQP